MMDAVAVMDRTNGEAGTIGAEAEAGIRDRLLDLQENVFLLCLGFARDAADARDLAQETYLKAMAHLADAPAEHLKPWLLRIARNTCLDQLRRLKVRRLFMPWLAAEAVEWKTPEAEAGACEEIAIVKRAIRALPGKLRGVLVLREYGGLSYEEIGQVLKIGTGTVMSRLSRARQAVLRYYREKDHGKRD